MTFWTKLFGDAEILAYKIDGSLLAWGKLISNPVDFLLYLSPGAFFDNHANTMS